MSKEKDLVAGLDIGTVKTCCVVAQVEGGKLEIVGVGKEESSGVRKGVIVNIDATVESINSAIAEAENMSGVEINSVYVGIAGSHLMDMNSHGVIAVNGNEVEHQDIDRVIEAAQAVNIPLDREILHVVSQEFIVDNQDGILKPLGMNGVRLESKVHIITAAIAATQNIIRSTNKAGLEAERIIVDQLAASEAVLDDDEKELGVAVIDIGGGASDIAIYADSSVRATKVVSLGGYNITHDISVGLRTPSGEAEKMKLLYGCASSRLVGSDEMISVPGVGGRSPTDISRKVLTDIIEPRVAEILMLSKKEIELSGFYSHISSGIVLTGGTALLPGIVEVAEEIFGLPVRIGSPIGIVGLADLVNSPTYATAVGLVKYTALDIKNKRRKKNSDVKIVSKLRRRITKWIQEFF